PAGLGGPDRDRHPAHALAHDPARPRGRAGRTVGQAGSARTGRRPVVVVAGVLADVRALAVAGIVLCILGVCGWGRALIRPARARPPRSFPAASVGAALAWLLVGLVVVAVTVAGSSSWNEVAGGFGPATAIFVAGTAAQVLLGALSYLLPVALGGGPAALKAAAGRFDAYGAARITVTNLGVLICLLPVPSW